MTRRPPMRIAVVVLLAALAACQQDGSSSTTSSGSSAASAIDALGSAVVDTRPLPPATVAAMAPASASAGSPASMPIVGDVPPPPMLPGAASASSGSSAAQLTAVRAQLGTLLAQAGGCHADAECRTVATGGKACGGPTGYRAYSVNGADPSTVAELAQRERDLSLVEARASGRVSACFMLADPGAHCQAQVCVTGPSGSGSGSAAGVSTR